MRKELDTVKLILGLKVHQLRQDLRLSYQQLSDRTGLAVSYLHNIEKGKKYPKADKLLLLAKALETDYNYLVSLDGDKRLQPIIGLLNSDFLKVFPLELFGIKIPKLMALLSDTPVQVNAFISTVSKILRNYHLQGEDFYRAALRSYQDLQNNYFEELEQAVADFKTTYQLLAAGSLSPARLEKLLHGMDIRVDREHLQQQAELKQLRSFYSKGRKTLYLNRGLSNAQENFLLAKELGFQHLQLDVRPYETRMAEIDSFEKLLNNFRASYFSDALLMDEQEMVDDIQAIAQWQKWNGSSFLQLLNKYDVTSEMLIQRLANILPRHFGVKNLFFLRFFADPHLQKYEMTKEIHLSQLHDPHANQLDEHYCRRWISINLIRQLKALQGTGETNGPIIGAQISRYWSTPNAYFCITIAKPDHDNTANSTSVTIGLLVDDQLRRLFRFLNDPEIVSKDVHTTCERCGITDCGARAAPPSVLQHSRMKAKIKQSLERLGMTRKKT